MAARALFTGFEACTLTGVRLSDRRLGCGSYASVQEAEYMGLKCAGKKIHELLLEQGNLGFTVRRFDEECSLLSQLRHPNIVQFLGVHFQEGVRVPILVMEYLPTNLTSCIEHHGILPNEISYSILHDVALGLCYLHGQTPPIIHRDLSSNNVLLTPHMTAKISDLGMARLLNLTPLQASHMTQTPGTPAYMPPEVMLANPKYDTSVDEFSYGILMIHIFSGRWPEPQIGPSQIEDGKLVPVTEIDRRLVFIRAIGNDHPLIDLIRRCVSNDPRCRAHSSEIVERLSTMALEYPASFANRLEMLRHIAHLEEDKLVLREEKATENHRNQQQMLHLSKEAAEARQQNLDYSFENEHLKLQLRDLDSQNQLLLADVEEMRTKVGVYETQINVKGRALEEKDSVISQLDQQLVRARQCLSSRKPVS